MRAQQRAGAAVLGILGVLAVLVVLLAGRVGVLGALAALGTAVAVLGAALGMLLLRARRRPGAVGANAVKHCDCCDPGTLLTHGTVR